MNRVPAQATPVSARDAVRGVRRRCRRPVELVLLAAVLGGLALVASASSAGTLTRLTTDPASDGPSAYSPDGSRIAFISQRDGSWGELYVMNANGKGEQLRLTRTGFQKAGDIVWSPDGRQVAFTQLQPYVRPEGSESCCEAEVYVVDAGGGKARNISNQTFTLPGVEPLNPSDDLQPTWSPGSDRIAFVSGRTGDLDIWVTKLSGKGAVDLTASPGFDYNAGPAWSPTGDRIVFESTRHAPELGLPSLYTMNPDGSGVTRLTEGGLAAGAKWSPDGTKIAFVRYQPDAEIYTMNADGTNQTNVSNLPSSDQFSPSWSGDSKQVAFYSSSEDFTYDIYAVTADGSGLTNLTDSPGVFDLLPSWSPTADEITFLSNTDDPSNFDVYKILVGRPSP